MRAPALLERLVPVSTRAVPMPLRAGAPLVVAALVLAAFWIGGAVVSDDFEVSMVATAVLVTAVGLLTLVVAARWRTTALPVLSSFLVMSVGVGGYLLLTSTRNVTVDEQTLPVDVAASPTGTTAPGASPATAVTLARGTFRANAHPTTGQAAVVRSGDRHVLVLRDFATDPGPDLRVYLATGDGRSLGEHVDLGRLKGNKGNQQYAIAPGVELDDYRSVVIWCRAFTVAFGTARLT